MTLTNISTEPSSVTRPAKIKSKRLSSCARRTAEGGCPHMGLQRLNARADVAFTVWLKPYPDTNRDFSGAGQVPVPRSSMTCGLEEALSMMVIVPWFAPFAWGENVALMVQFAPGATLVPQVEVMAKAALAFID
jgi:hypothetical protein